jgi:hypothetical protein
MLKNYFLNFLVPTLNLKAKKKFQTKGGYKKRGFLVCRRYLLKSLWKDLPNISNLTRPQKRLKQKLFYTKI